MRNNPNRYARPNDHGFEDVREQGVTATVETLSKLRPDLLLRYRFTEDANGDGLISQDQFDAGLRIREVHDYLAAEAASGPWMSKVDGRGDIDRIHTYRYIQASESDYGVYAKWQRAEGKRHQMTLAFLLEGYPISHLTIRESLQKFVDMASLEVDNHQNP